MHAKTIYLKDYQPPAFLIEHVQLQVQIFEVHCTVNAHLQVRKNPDSPKVKTLVLDGVDLTLEQVALNQEVLAADAYQVDNNQLRIALSDEIIAAESFSLATQVRIYPHKNTSLEGLYVSNGMYCTQCEAEGFRKITYYLDRPDVMSRFEVTVEADKIHYPQLLSNGNLIDAGDLKGNRHFCTWQDPFPKPAYLFALVAGKLSVTEDIFTTCNDRKIALKIYTEAKDQDKVAHAMASLKAAMKWDEQTYGLEYDLDLYMIVAVSHFNMGAMENKGLNIFNTSCVLASLETSTDAEFQRVEGVIAHEYFHNYSGNRVTCRDWFQLSLKEGLTVYRDQCFSADMGLQDVKRVEDVACLRTFQFAEDASPLAHPVRPDHYIEINNFYTLTVYEKGAELVRMLRTLLGEDGFRRGTDLYFSRHDGQAVTTDDFVQALVDANPDHADLKKININQFKHWYAQAGTPKLIIKSNYQRELKRYTLEVEQVYPALLEQPEYQPYLIPLKISLLNATGQSLPLTLTDESMVLGKAGDAERVLLVNQPKQLFEFNQVQESPTPSLLRDFSAPIHLDYAYSDEDLGHLFKHDRGFGQYEAAHQLFMRSIRQGVEHCSRSSKTPKLPKPLAVAFANTLDNPDIHDAFKAELLATPNLLAIIETYDEINIDVIHSVRESLRAKLAETFVESLLTEYERYFSLNRAATDPDAMGVRALKNCFLSYLAVSGQDEITALVETAYASAITMTDRLNALRIAVHQQHTGSDALLEDFYDRWQNEALVIDQWFGVQATTAHESCLSQVESLLSHPAFSWTNPNRVRSLIGRFSVVNLTQFHRADGGGYKFLGDAILQMNEINPQVAARLLKPFSSWSRYTKDRQILMRSQLKRILDQQNVSDDVYEIASKSLGEAG